MKEPISEWNMYDKVKIGDLMPAFELLHGDCLQQLTTLPAASVDAVVCDPPYGLKFLGKDWDHGVPGVAFWSAALRVAKPGAHLLAFGGTRTFHRLAVAIEDAGWEIRDTVMWVYGSGFPKSLDVSKAIDKAAGVTERPIIGEKFGAERLRSQAPNGSRNGEGTWGDEVGRDPYLRGSVTAKAKQWEGWGTALKPAWEPILVCRKPLEGTVAANVLAHGTSAINIDGCRVGSESVTINTWDDGAKPFGGGAGHAYSGRTVQGRWPANLIHDGSDEVLEAFAVAGERKSCNSPSKAKCQSKFRPEQGEYQPQGPIYPGDTGSAARFFYCAKASKADRDEGCEGMQAKQYSHDGRETPIENAYQRNDSKSRNHHPTVKPTALMRYLCKLVTPLNGIILDPFMGSGSTGKAAVLEGFNFIGIEKDAEYIAIARARIASAISGSTR